MRVELAPVQPPPCVCGELTEEGALGPSVALAEATFLDAFGPGQTLSLGDFLKVDVRRMAALGRQYADLKLGGTDAAVIATAERFGHHARRDR